MSEQTIDSLQIEAVSDQVIAALELTLGPDVGVILIILPSANAKKVSPGCVKSNLPPAHTVNYLQQTVDQYRQGYIGPKAKKN